MTTITETMYTFLSEAEIDKHPEEILHTLQQMEEYWERKQLYLESVCVHNDLEEAEATLSNLRSAALCDDNDDFQAAHRLLQIQLEHISRSESLRFGNIL